MDCLSYVIGCREAKFACVMDPKRDVQDYIDITRKNDMKITHIFETHVHTDHSSGNMELKSRTGVEVFFMEGNPVKFDNKVVKEGDVIEFGIAKLELIQMPGHTPYSMSILVTDKSRMGDPWLVLTGGCLFIGDVVHTRLSRKEQILFFKYGGEICLFEFLNLIGTNMLAIVMLNHGLRRLYMTGPMSD